jgi:hypothetical protein
MYYCLNLDLQCQHRKGGSTLKEILRIIPDPNSKNSERQKNNKQRSRTLSRKQMAREHRQMRHAGELVDSTEADHPRTRRDCYKMARPCYFVSCRHHLYLDVNPETGSIKFNFPGKEVWELEETCGLDVAERGGITLEEVGRIMNLTRERVRQLEILALERLKSVPKKDTDLEMLSFNDPEDEQA